MIDVVMPVWAIDSQTIDITEAAIESLKASKAECSFVLIDNGSTVGGGKLREMADVYIRNKVNLGYAKAVNQGLMISGQRAAIANNDIRVSPNWLEVAEEIMQDPTVGTVHYRMIPYDQPFEYGDKTFLTGRERWCTGSFFVARNIQLFDDEFFNSYDDWDYQYRFRQSGFKTAYTTKACYQHMNSFTQEKVGNRSENDKRNREHFQHKHGRYPEDLFAEQFPEQFAQDWGKYFNER